MSRKRRGEDDVDDDRWALSMVLVTISPILLCRFIFFLSCCIIPLVFVITTVYLIFIVLDNLFMKEQLVHVWKVVVLWPCG